jgi:hypothetical protein
VGLLDGSIAKFALSFDANDARVGCVSSDDNQVAPHRITAQSVPRCADASDASVGWPFSNDIDALPAKSTLSFAAKDAGVGCVLTMTAKSSSDAAAFGRRDTHTGPEGRASPSPDRRLALAPRAHTYSLLANRGPLR